jgi:hypothetical protein
VLSLHQCFFLHFGDLLECDINLAISFEFLVQNLPIEDPNYTPPPKNIYEDDEIIILVWYSTINVNHYHWFRDRINQISFNYKAKHLVQIIQHMFKFLLLLTLIAT